MQGGSALDWHEAWVLASGFAKDPQCRLFREMDPDWEWHTVPAFLAAYTLQAVQSGNWQRGGGKGNRPKLFTPQLVRGEDPSNATKTGVVAGPRKAAGVEITGEGAAGLAAAADELAARRRKKTG